MVYSRIVERLAAVRLAVFELRPVFGKRIENNGRNRPTGVNSRYARLVDDIQMSAAFEECARSESGRKAADNPTATFIPTYIPTYPLVPIDISSPFLEPFS